MNKGFAKTKNNEYIKAYSNYGGIMRAPSKAGASKLDNPTRVRSNQPLGTDPHVLWEGTDPCEAGGMAVGQPQCESVKVLSPEIFLIPRGPRCSYTGSQY